jgi:hypothetical protein
MHLPHLIYPRSRRNSCSIEQPLPLFLSFLVLFTLANLSLAKGRASLSSPSLASTNSYHLHVAHPNPNQRVYGVSDSAGDVFLLLKCVVFLPAACFYAYMLRHIHAYARMFLLPPTIICLISFSQALLSAGAERVTV